jgi:hypothetical protein
VSVTSIFPLDDVARFGAEHGDANLYRAAIGALDEGMSADLASVALWIADEPRLTSSRRADVIVAALTEHVAFHRDVAAPDWVERPERFLRSVWFPVDTPSIRVRAIVSSPASFARRLIYIDRSDLDRV